MSIENVNQFYQVVLQDSALQQQLQFAPDEESMVNLAVELGQQKGYDFTSEEVIQAIALAQPPAQTTGMVELADEQLEAVAGGKGADAAMKAAAAGAATGALVGTAVGPEGTVAGGAIGATVGFFTGLFAN